MHFGLAYAGLGAVQGEDMPVLAMMLLAVLPLALVLAAVCDLRTMMIPDRISIALVLLFLPAAVIGGLSGAQVALALAAAVAVFLAGFCLFALHVMGGGDAKLLSASALWFGFNISLFEYLVAVSFAGGALALAVLVLRQAARRLPALACAMPASLISSAKLPYAVAIAIGGLASFGKAPLFLALLAAAS